MGNEWSLQVPKLRVVSSCTGLNWLVLRGSCTPPPYGAAHRHDLPHFSDSEEIGLQSQRSVEYESLGIEFGCICLGCFGPEISLGDWRKAVSRMAAPYKSMRSLCKMQKWKRAKTKFGNRTDYTS